MEQIVLPILSVWYCEQICQYLLSRTPSVCILSRFPPPELSSISCPMHFPHSVSPDMNEISHSFTSAPQNNAAMLSSYTLQTLPKCQWCPYPVGCWFQGTALCLLGLLLIEPAATALSLPFGKPSSLGYPPAASRWGVLSSSKSTGPLRAATPKRPVVPVFLKSTYKILLHLWG